MKVLFLHNPTSGKGIKEKQLNYIKKELSSYFEDFTFEVPPTPEAYIQRAKEACGIYDYLIFTGGDGSVHMILNAIANQEKKPILGLFPTGTCNDSAKNYGINKNIKRNLRIIKEGHVEAYDVLLYNETKYCVYAIAVGELASIPYLTTKKDKRIFGAFAYYFDAIPRFFRNPKIHGYVILDDQTKVDFCVPFVMVMNSARVGGFNINPKSDIQDGKCDIFLCQKRTIPALVRFALRSKHIPHYQVQKCFIHTDCPEDWDVDGERGSKGDVKIEVLQGFLKVLSPAVKK